MSPTDRCDQVIRLIDEVLDADDAERGDRGDGESRPSNEAASETDENVAVEAVPGQWGVYYLKPA